MLDFVDLVRAIVTFALSSDCLLVQIDRSKTSPLLLLVHVIHQFPLGAWVEHHAVHSNGKFLATLLTTPDLFHVVAANQSVGIPITAVPGSSSLRPACRYEDVALIRSGLLML
jgi:hypothetical protein